MHPNFLGGITVNYLKQFIIPFSGLKPGNYLYTFETDDRFFEQFEYSEIKKGNVHVDCRLEKQERMMVFHFELTGVVKVICDRCAGEFDWNIGGTQQLIVKFGPEHTEETEDILVITEKEHEIDISQYLYEYVHLLVPIKKVHGTDENGKSLCDPDVIKYINEEEEHTADPRWEVLKKLKDNSQNDNK